MALNYLQRVAAAAQRTAAPAKPVTTGPPRMPGIPGPLAKPFASAEPHLSEADSTWDTIDPTTDLPPVKQPLDRVDLPEAKAAPWPAPTPAREHRPAEPTTSLFESMLRPAAELIGTPPGLRSLARSDPDRAMRPAAPPRSGPDRAMQPAAPPPPLARPPNLEARLEGVQDTASSDIRSAPPPPPVTTTATPGKPMPSATAQIQPPPAVLPKPQPAAALPNSRAGKTESRIHIGRVEVQVNNRRPVSPAPKTAPAVAPASDSLAARYLGRFLLRP